MFSALNDVYGEAETRSFVRKTATSLAFTVGGILGLLVGGRAASPPLPSMFEVIGLNGTLDVGREDRAMAHHIDRAHWGFITAFIVLDPSRHVAKWRWVTWGRSDSRYSLGHVLSGIFLLR